MKQLEALLRDCGFVFRSLLRARNFALTILTVMILGTGVAALVFKITAWLVLFPQPYPHPERLYSLGFRDKRGVSSPVTFPLQLEAYQQQTNVFSDYAAVTRDAANVVINNAPIAANVISASADCFRTLGIRPILGRGFLPTECQPGGERVIVVTERLWRNFFQGSPEALGKSLLIDQQPFTIVGVLSEDQRLPPMFDGDIYRPLSFNVEALMSNPLTPAVYAIVRLAPGVTVEHARNAIAAVHLPKLPEWATIFLANQQPILFKPTDALHPESFRIIGLAALLLYVMACLNAVNLMVIRQLGRHRELSIRSALGAARTQIFQLLAVEGIGLAVVAGLSVTIAIKWVFPQLLARLEGKELNGFKSFTDSGTFECTAVVSIFIAVAVTLLPMWQLLKGKGLAMGLKAGKGPAGEGHHAERWRSVLVVFQAALAFILVAGSGLMVRTFLKIQHTNLGFDRTGKVKVMVMFPTTYNLPPQSRLQLFEKLQARLLTVPGVKAVSFGQDSLLVGGFWGSAQLQMADGSYQPVEANFVAADFLKTSGVMLKRGRWLSGKPGEFEVVINESFARARFGNSDPVGQSFKILVSGDAPNPVVGVIADVKDTVRGAPSMRFYVPNWVYPMNISSLLIKMDDDPRPEFSSVVRRAVYEVDPRIIVNDVVSITGIIDREMWAERYAFKVLIGLSLIALFLATIGLYSVISYTVERRTQEFGVRMALGARPFDLYWLVLIKGLATTGVGIVVGLAGTLLLGRFMQSLLFETEAADPVVLIVVAITLFAAALAACWLPARRAAHANINNLLKTD